MTAKEYLSQAKHLDTQIEAKLEQVARLKSLLTRGTTRLTGMPRGSGGADWTAVADKYLTLEAELNADIDRYVDLKREIARCIAEVPVAEYRMLLEYRYLAGWDWARVAHEMHYSRDWAWHMHGNALSLVRVP